MNTETINIRQLQRFLQLLEEQGMIPLRFQPLLGWPLADLLDPDARIDKNNRDAIRQLLGLEPVVVPEVFEFTVDYQVPVEDMLTATGCSVESADLLVQRFPIRRRNEVVTFEAKLKRTKQRSCFGEDGWEQIMSKPDKEGWRPGCFEHQLAFATKYKEPRRFHTVALGSRHCVSGWPSLIAYLERRNEKSRIFCHNPGIGSDTSVEALFVREKN